MDRVISLVEYNNVRVKDKDSSSEDIFGGLSAFEVVGGVSEEGNDFFSPLELDSVELPQIDVVL